MKVTPRFVFILIFFETNSLLQATFRQEVAFDDGGPEYAQRTSCSAGGKAVPLTYKAGNWLNLFTSLTFECEGQITSWEFCADRAGTFYAGVWRPDGSTQWTFVGRNKITALGSGCKTIPIGRGDRVEVQSGDAISIHYDNDASEKGVVPYADSRQSPYCSSCGIGSNDLSPFLNAGYKDETLYLGMTLSSSENSAGSLTRLPALSANVEEPTCGNEGVIVDFGYEPLHSNNMDSPATPVTIITDPSQALTEDGVVVGWKFYMNIDTAIYLQIWRPIRGDKYMLVGETSFDPGSTGVQDIDFDGNLEEFRIPVLKGDILGIYFSRGTVPYKGYTPCSSFNSHLYVHTPSKPRQWEQVDFIREIGYCRQYSLAAKVLLKKAPSPPIPPPVPTTGPVPTGGPAPPTPPTPGPGPGNTIYCGTPVIQPTQGRIVGGYPALPHSWPWMVSLQSTSGFSFCGGTLISLNWVVTAAHCVPSWSNFDSTKQVSVGSHNIYSPSSVEQKIPVDYVISHPNYVSAGSGNDIALLKLNRNAVFGDKVRHACIPEQDDPVKDGQLCYVTGWGTTSSGGSASNTLLQVGVPLITASSCSQYYGHIGDTMVCAGYPEGGKDSCQGDSGGPLVCQVDGKWELTGIVSWGNGCAFAGYPGVYARTSKFSDWIWSTIKAYDN